MYYTKVHIDNLEQLQQSILDKLPPEALTTHGVLPMWSQQLMQFDEIKNIIQELGLESTAYCVCIVTMQPWSEFPVHIDSGKSQAALNIPLANCNNTFTHWYQSTQPLIEYQHHGDGKYLGADKNLCTRVASLEMTEPHFINIGALHNVDNPNNSWRILLSIRLTDYNFNSQ